MSQGNYQTHSKRKEVFKDYQEIHKMSGCKLFWEVFAGAMVQAFSEIKGSETVSVEPDFLPMKTPWPSNKEQGSCVIYLQEVKQIGILISL